MTDVLLLGSTGSIGTQALEVVAFEGLRVRGLAAGGSNIALLARQVHEFHVPTVALARPGSGQELKSALEALGHREPVSILEGQDAARELVSKAERGWKVLNGLAGAIGLEPTLEALDRGAYLLLANKESLVIGGDLVRARQAFAGQVLPIDSEHSAIFQALAAGSHPAGMCAVSHSEQSGSSEVARLILTASGGPFRGKSREELRHVSPREALAHPTWQMGPLVSINSATLINKGLELIEAHLLFDIPPEQITVTVHPQSVVHSMVEWADGSTILQASPPSMRLPIAYALTYPRRSYPVPPCQWSAPTSWTFEPVDDVTFPAIELARQAIAASATHPAALNGANEECVAAFLEERIGFLDIVDTVRRVVEEHLGVPRGSSTLEDVTAADQWARRRAREIVGERQ